MSLSNSFYIEVFTKEKRWIELINKNLLNSIYCYHELKPYYLNKREELISNPNSENKIISGIVESINLILRKIEEFNAKFRNNEPYNIKELLPLFLTTQMGVKEKTNEKMDNLKLKEQVLNSLTQKNEMDDYLYDDFPVETVKTK